MPDVETEYIVALEADLQLATRDRNEAQQWRDAGKPVKARSSGAL